MSLSLSCHDHYHLLTLSHAVLGQSLLLQQGGERPHHGAHVEDGGGADGDGEHSENRRSFSKKSFFYDEFYLLNISRDAKLIVPNQYW